MDQYAEIRLGVESEQTFLRRFLKSAGYEYSGPRMMQGMSGLDHSFDAVGMRANNIALVLSGPKDLGLRHKTDRHHDGSPKFRSEVWCRDALLRLYDVSAILERDGLKVDLIFFENRLTHTVPYFSDSPFRFVEEWVKNHNLPQDILGHWHTSISPIDLPALRYLPNTAQCAGACYLGLNDLTVNEVASICGADESEADACSMRTLKRLRVDQYFNPPVDELVLTALALGKCSESSISQVYEASASLQHAPVANAIIEETDYSDPVAVARALERHGQIEYSAELRITESGRELVHKVMKTSQENWVIKCIKAIGLKDIAKSVTEGLMKSWTGQQG